MLEMRKRSPAEQVMTTVHIECHGPWHHRRETMNALHLASSMKSFWSGDCRVWVDKVRLKEVYVHPPQLPSSSVLSKCIDVCQEDEAIQ